MDVYSILYEVRIESLHKIQVNFRLQINALFLLMTYISQTYVAMLTPNCRNVLLHVKQIKSIRF